MKWRFASKFRKPIGPPWATVSWFGEWYFWGQCPNSDDKTYFDWNQQRVGDKEAAD